jgi:catechol 2,3-dioxygenase-like lactoylglutathione lyase family enzyme
MMLSKLEFHGTIPATDLDRAKWFYSEKLGFKPDAELPGGIVYRCKDWFSSISYPVRRDRPAYFRRLADG